MGGAPAIVLAGENRGESRTVGVPFRGEGAGRPIRFAGARQAWYNFFLMKVTIAAARLLAVVLIIGVGGARAADRPILLTLSAGIHPVFAYGSVSDYAVGSNDFPVTPAHRPWLAGLSFGRSAGRWLFELETRWVGPAAVTLDDPSDGDSVTFSTSPRLLATLGAYFRLLTGRFQPYLGAGAGVDVVMAGETSAVSRAGYSIVIPAPAFKDRFDPIVQAGGGILIGLGGRFGARLDARYVWVLDRPNPVLGVQATAALTVAF
jgi:hypothetical protein